MGRKPSAPLPLEAEFVAQLKHEGKAASTIRRYRFYARKFMRYFGDVPLHRVSEAEAREFFNGELGHWKKQSKVQAIMAISQFLKLAASRLPAPVVSRGSKAAPAPVVQSEKEITLREKWSLDKLVDAKENADDLIAQLARKLIDHYLYFQGRMKGEPENLDDVARFTDECRELIEKNLPLFMGLSAGGRNIHSKIDERVQR